MLAAAAVPRANADEYAKTYAVASRPEVHVQAGDSSVRVTTSDTNQVEFRVRSQGVRVAIGFGGQVSVDSQQSGNRVELVVKTTPALTIGFNDRRLETEVQMPENADLLIETHDGAVELSAVNGNITVHTKDGAIRATQLSGRIDLHSSDGGINAQSLKGDARLHSGDGSIGAGGIDGKLEASTNDGSIHVEGRFDSLTITSGDGSVTARVAQGSKMTSDWSVQTHDGSLRMSIPSDLRANLDVSANNGHISLDLPVTVQGINSQSKIRGTLNGGGPLLTVRSGDGSVRLAGT
jgi:DUF4097 and DUF4098 domain-containing protein YvlB